MRTATLLLAALPALLGANAPAPQDPLPSCWAISACLCYAEWEDATPGEPLNGFDACWSVSINEPGLTNAGCCSEGAPPPYICANESCTYQLTLTIEITGLCSNDEFCVEIDNGIPPTQHCTLYEGVGTHVISLPSENVSCGGQSNRAIEVWDCTGLVGGCYSAKAAHLRWNCKDASGCDD